MGQADLTCCYPLLFLRILPFATETIYLVSSKLSGIWKDATAGSTVRAIKVSIVNEALEEDGIFNIKGTFEQGINGHLLVSYHTNPPRSKIMFGNEKMWY